MNTSIASITYSALRHGGAPPARVLAQLGLGRSVAIELERWFCKRRGGVLRPRFARHDVHVRAVLEQGGFPDLPERRR